MVDRPGTCRVTPSGPGRSARGGAYGGEAPRGSVDSGLERVPPVVTIAGRLLFSRLDGYGTGAPMPKTLYAEFSGMPGNESRVPEMMRELAAHVRQEPGNVVFEPYVEEANPNRYFV